MRGTIVDVVVIPQGSSEIKIDISKLAKGTYFATAKSENQVIGRAKFLVL